MAFNGYLPRDYYDPMDVHERISHHIRENGRSTDQTPLLVDMINYCNAHGIGVKVVITPCRSDYNALLTEGDEVLFKSLFALKKKLNFKLYNLRCSPLFDESDFVDCDHLNCLGAAKLTRLLDK